LSMFLSTPSIMRLPEIVLTTLYEALLAGFLLHVCMITGITEIRYEVLYDYPLVLRIQIGAYPCSSIAFWYSA
jgi:hypothetical protein